MTTLTNIRIANLRANGYKDLAHWCEDDNHVYIGRGGVVFANGARYPKMHSKWHNPYKIGQDGTRDEVIDKYRQYIKRTELISQIGELENKTLGCWCYPEKCHGDVLIELLDKY